MKRRGRFGFIPSADDIYVVGALVEFAPEHDRTGNAANPAPPIPFGPAGAEPDGVRADDAGQPAEPQAS